MSGPIVFISHFRVRDGTGDNVRAMLTMGVERIRSEKPRTASMAAYLDEDGSRVSIVHVFPDADAMDAHFEGSDQRSASAYEVIKPAGWEIYGPASSAAVDQMRREAAIAGVPLTVARTLVAGFLRSVAE
jgi:quinol monooxygenase YgiN